MSPKTIAIIAYLTIIGWIIAYFQYKDRKTALCRYHLEQALGVFIFSFIWSALLRIVLFILPFVLPVFGLLSIVPLVLIVIGMVNASREQLKPVPVIGKFFEGRLGDF